MWPFLPLQTCAILSLLVLPTRSELVNRTIDDWFGDKITGFKPEFRPPSAWCYNNQLRTNCPLDELDKLDPNLVFSSTWTMYTSALLSPQDASITLSFKGVAIYVFFILTPALHTQCRFELDGKPFPKPITSYSSTKLEHRALVFAHAGLENMDHKLVIVPEGSSMIIFDYVMYTSSSQSHGHSEPTITSSRTISAINPKISVSDSPAGLGSISVSPESGTSTSSPMVIITSTGSGHGQASTPPPADTTSGHPSTTIQRLPPSSDSLPDSNNRQHIGLITGVVIGPVIISLVAVIAFLLYKKRRARVTVSPLIEHGSRAMEGSGPTFESRLSMLRNRMQRAPPFYHTLSPYGSTEMISTISRPSEIVQSPTFVPPLPRTKPVMSLGNPSFEGVRTIGANTSTSTLNILRELTVQPCGCSSRIPVETQIPIQSEMENLQCEEFREELRTLRKLVEQMQTQTQQQPDWTERHSGASSPPTYASAPLYS
ncbi:hypothetical protein AMATHDRAFT_2774 [Amanita thiersii Skay4041]|uniref:Mid2 domain-containing protein n=1 Tax=Amanita thiersii Skay4041 TaxID=703135 RepID=A0A2A9NTR6_9AGAR|nr:hypothetical protein AMATHDRAFT_2774 [Amanita thiersii Skay4041]